MMTDLYLNTLIFLQSAWRYVLPRTIFSITFFAIMSGNLDFVARLISHSPIQFLSFSYDVSLIISGTATIMVGWFSFGLMADVLNALGYRDYHSRNEKTAQ